MLVAWHALGSGLAVEMAAAAGWDAALIDQQHGFGGQSELLAGLTAARAGGIPAFVRVAWNDHALIGRALDGGAAGIVCPMINDADDAARLVEAAKYPPLGARSWGPYRAAPTFGGDYFAEANGATLVFAQIETGAALDNLDAILATKGLGGILVGPNDLAVSLTGGRDIRDGAVLAAIDDVLTRARDAGVIGWIFANDDSYARDMRARGWTMLSIGTDGGWLRDAAGAQLAAIARGAG